MPDDAAVRLRIATRASQLALWQAHHVADLLREKLDSVEVEIVHISTHGDRDQSEPLSQMGGTGVFTKEVQLALLDGRADIAVHSLKDLPTEQAEGLVIAAIPDREIVYDALVLPENSDGGNDSSEQQPVDVLGQLPHGARVGTGSLRRQAQLLHARPDLELAEIRGNVDTRLRKLDDGDYDAIILAAAGLTRLELGHRISSLLKPPSMFPAVGQGALGLECRVDDQTTQTALAHLTNAGVFSAASAERALLRTLRAGCHAPVGVFSGTLDNGDLKLTGVVLSRDGQERLSAESSAPMPNAEALGQAVAEQLIAAGAERLIGE